MNKYHRNKRGFTLIELLITLAVLVILISVGVASYSGLFSQQELLQRTERLYHFLRLANSQAIKQNKTIYVHFCASGDTWKMAMAEQSSCDCFTANSCTLNGLERVEELADGQTISTSSSDVTFSSEQASFSPMRFGINSGSVTLTDTNGSSLKVVQSIHRLKICAPDKAQLGYEKC